MDKVAERFAELAERYGPHAVDAARSASRMEAMSCLMGSLLWVAVSLVLTGFGRWMLVKARNGDGPDTDLITVAGFTVLGVGLAAMIPAIWAWIDPWTWTAINNPDLWIAKKVLGL